MVIGNRTLLPIKVAASQVSYSRDYVARLAREGKIAAAQVNRQWYIDPESLLNFYQTAQLELQARAEYIREMRRHDLELRDFVTIASRRQTQRQRVAPQRVLVETIVVITIALFVGLLVHSLQMVLPGQLSVIAATFNSASSVQSAAVLESLIDDTVTTWWSDAPEVTIEDTELSLDNGIVLLPVTATGEATSTEPADLFSDPVTVEMRGTEGGVIYLENDTTSTTMPFLFIPEESTVRRNE